VREKMSKTKGFQVPSPARANLNIKNKPGKHSISG
jgi:hypothetical protein